MDYLTEIKKKHSPAWKGGALADRKAMFATVKRVASQEGLSLALTNDVLLTIAGESGYNQWCQNEDTKDYGLCQFSLKYYCKEYKMTPQDCLENPEKQARIMCVNFKNGRQSNWVAYANRKQHANQLIELSEPPKQILEEKRTAIENAKSLVPEFQATNTPVIEIKTGLLYLLIKWVANWLKKW